MHKLGFEHLKGRLIYVKTRTDQALCADITYVYMEEGFLFLSLMMDMYVREIVG